MTQLVRPYLEIQPPNGNPYTLCLKDLDRCTIGRDDNNDLCLPDPEKFISREHCRLEKINGYWWLIDDDQGASGRPSASGTYLRPADQPNEVNVQDNGREPLRNGDTFSIVAQVVNEEEFLYWEFVFHDDSTTRKVPGRPSHTSSKTEDGIYYTLSTQTLTKGNGEIISLPKNPTKLIRFMAQKNQARDGQPTPCRFREMIGAVWGENDSFGKKDRDITHLVWQIRQKIETDPANPQYIHNLPGDGYLLKIPIKP